MLKPEILMQYKMLMHLIANYVFNGLVILVFPVHGYQFEPVVYFVCSSGYIFLLDDKIPLD